MLATSFLDCFYNYPSALMGYIALDALAQSRASEKCLIKEIRSEI